MYVNLYVGEKMSAKRMKTLPETTESIYYFVSINCPLKEPFLDVNMLKEATKGYRINIDDGEFLIISSDDTHAFYLYQFKNSKPASKAREIDFSVGMEDVSTSTILCDEGETIDFDLTTKSDAEEAAKKAVNDVVAVVVEMTKMKTDHEHMITQISLLVSVPITTIGAEAVQVPVVQLPPLPYQIPEAMFNEMVQHEVGIKARSMGFIVASNTSTIPFSQYFDSRPDLSIYHPNRGGSRIFNMVGL